MGCCRAPAVTTLSLAAGLVLACDSTGPESDRERPPSLIAFFRDGERSIYTVRPDGSELHLIARGRPARRSGNLSFGEPQWSPDGEHLAYVRFDGEDPAQESLIITRWDGSDPHTVVSPAPYRISDFAWSPYGDRLVYVSHAPGTGTPPQGYAIPGSFALYVVRTDGSDEHRLPYLGYSYPSFLCPSWSPQGDRLSFANLYDAVWTVAPDGTEPLRIFAGTLECARWSPNGRRIALVTNRNVESFGEDPRFELYLVNPDGSALTKLTNPPDSEGEPLWWSPDGTRLAFIGVHGGVFGLYVMQEDGTGIIRLPTDVGIAPMLAWSPDGTQLAFVSGFVTQRDIYVINVDGSSSRNLTNSPEDEYDLDWR